MALVEVGYASASAVAPKAVPAVDRALDGLQESLSYTEVRLGELLKRLERASSLDDVANKLGGGVPGSSCPLASNIYDVQGRVRIMGERIDEALARLEI